MDNVFVMQKDKETFVMIKNNGDVCDKCFFRNREKCPSSPSCVEHCSYWEKINMDIPLFNPFSLTIDR